MWSARAAAKGLGAILLASAGFSTAHATTVLPKSLPELAATSPVVVHGRVVQIEVAPDTGRRTAVVEALEIPRAPEALRHKRDFHVQLLNRALPHSDLVEWVPGAPELFEGEELVLFLRPIDRLAAVDRRLDGQMLFALDGFHQGKFRVMEDSLRVRRVLAWDQAPRAAPEPASLRAARTTVRRSLRALSTPRLMPADTQNLQGDLSRVPTLSDVLDRVRAAGAGP